MNNLYYWADTLGNRVSPYYDSWIKAYKAQRANWINYTIKKAEL